MLLIKRLQMKRLSKGQREKKTHMDNENARHHVIINELM